ncbi:hypothetical protein [Novosphingobium sp. Gsoil 351]|uniref:hypothetical protein n=1 Tax=Novosphingobium sp. Gsoil 351 TaxID=2675225 RepID=UPI0012B4FC10|nr:hypothetical protein [Novosphingobium sp. Gsoil 351]QGN55630.1 hypothetical protein GKE62_14840 [Novosphingobium sp. Gsoil 351]
MSGHGAYKDRSWLPQPAAETCLQAFLDAALARVPAASAFAGKLLETTGVRVRDIVDSIECPDIAQLGRFQGGRLARRT